MDETTASSLLDGIRKGVPRAWERMVDIWAPLLQGYCRNRGFAPEVADDIAQNVMLRVYRGIHQFERNGRERRLRYWIAAITRNEIVDFCRRNSAHPVAIGGSEHQLQLNALRSVDDSSTDEPVFQPAIILARTLQVVEQDFEPHVWRAFELFKRDGLTAREVAKVLGMTENSVRQAALRVCRRLRAEMADLLDSP